MIYFVETRANEQRVALCRWVERFFEEGKKVQVVADSTMAAQHLDQLLWTYSEGSFIPHRIYDAKTSDSLIEPVVITIGEVRLEEFEILLCDGPANLHFMKQYPVAVHFILRDDEDRKQESRLMWQSARDQGVQLHHVPYTSTMRRP
jgi:DNA polymerase-3 subunit chi